MLFNIKINKIVKFNSFQKNSVQIKCFVDNSKLKSSLNSFDKEMGIGLSDYQTLCFLDKDNKELKISNQTSSPDIFILRKVKLDKKFSVDFFRNYYAGLIQSFKKERLKYLYIEISDYKNYAEYFDSELHYIQSCVEGILLGNYSFDKYRKRKKKLSILNVVFQYSNKKILDTAAKRAETIISSVAFARDLVNDPAISLTPSELFTRSKKDLSILGVKVTSLNKKELERKKMGGILAVGSGSDNPPQLIILKYKPSGKVNRKVALVGKGVTYDSGGLSIKSTDGMVDMKADMGGAAAVIGTIKAAAEAQLPIELVGIIPAVENMISGSSYKPGDVVTSYSGKTIEVKNTDAEGRIVLADALTYAAEQKPDEIIDFATLTGAICVALGLIPAGLFSANDKLADALVSAGNSSFERLWRMPFWDDYKVLLKSDIADVSNLGPRWGGAITAAKFLEHFVDEKMAWAHIDLAGPALKNDYNNYTKKYDTGFGVRLMFEYLSNV